MRTDRARSVHVCLYVCLCGATVLVNSINNLMFIATYAPDKTTTLPRVVISCFAIALQLLTPLGDTATFVPLSNVLVTVLMLYENLLESP